MKKVLTMMLAMLLVAAISIGGTLAYLTSKDEAVNTFTMGKVRIDLTEHKNDGSAYDDQQLLLPGTSKKNAIEKNACVTVLEGSEPSWVWVDILVPAELYLDTVTGNESANGLHFNQWKDYIQGYENQNTGNPNGQAAAKTFKPDWQWSTAKYVGKTTVEIDNKQVEFVILRTTHKDIVNPKERTSPAMSQVYMDWRVYEQDGTYYVPADVNASTFKPYTGPWKVIVRAYAIQAAGIANVEDAVHYYYNQAEALK